MLIHATITVTGEQSALAECEVRLRKRLAPYYLRDEVEEHHGDRALCYDLKVEGGIPFPLIAETSREFPALEFGAEWVNVEAGERGSATLVDGRIRAQQTDRVGTAAAGEHPVYVAIAEDGSLDLAMMVFRAGREEWRGYAITATRDALLRILRGTGAVTIELYATDGAAEWALYWRGGLAAGLEGKALDPPLAIERATFEELERLAKAFASEWIWFMASPDAEIAIEKERYARRGYAVSDANIRTARLYRMQADTGNAGVPMEYSTLPDDEEWIRELILATWAAEEEA